jgi:hypothetical protein
MISSSSKVLMNLCFGSNSKPNSYLPCHALGDTVHHDSLGDTSLTASDANDSSGRRSSLRFKFRLNSVLSQIIIHHRNAHNFRIKSPELVYGQDGDRKPTLAFFQVHRCKCRNNPPSLSCCYSCRLSVAPCHGWFWVLEHDDGASGERRDIEVGFE